MRFFIGLTLFFSTLLLSAQEIKHHRFIHTWNDNGGGTRCLRMEVLRDDIVHFEIYERRERDHEKKCLAKKDMIWTSPMVHATNGPGKYFDPGSRGTYKVTYHEGYTGPTPESYREHNDGIETKRLRIKVYNDSRCISVFDKNRNTELTNVCAEELDKADKFLRVDKNQMTHFYGVGNPFTRGETADGDWKGINYDIPKLRGTPGNLRGPTFHGGDPSTSQFPMVYALGPELLNYGIFFDNAGRMTMYFNEDKRFSYETYGDELRFFIIAGDDLKKVRASFMGLTGKPPVPPMSQFGHWTSKFGFKNWTEAEDEVKALRKAGFPLDGVALDLQWFGGEFGKPEVFRMGVLQFMEKDKEGKPLFSDPAKEIPRFYSKYGVHFMPIEESYIDERLDEHRALCDDKYRMSKDGFKGITDDAGCFLARMDLDKGDAWKAARITVDFKRALADKETVWWGRGGMLDHSNPHMRFFWHQLKRRWLSKMGIFNHWFDLGEPEMFFEFAFYNGFPELFREYTTYDGKPKKNIVQKHGDIHNLYNLFWAKGADEGYANPENQNMLKGTLNQFYENDYEDGPRHWTMSRAGTVGSQRYGAMWTGDTKGNFENLRGHLQTQLHMSLVGVDYYSGDAGGFFHVKEGKDPKDQFDAVLYKQWFATASLLDIPLRPHGWALEEGISYGAHVRGHAESNRANVWRRYELIPYLYSLAHRAHRYAEPMFPPLVYHFQTDKTVRENGTEKMIGPSLLFRIFADWKGYGNPETPNVPVYLPKGTWIDYESLEWMDSNGGITKKIDLFRRERVPASEPKDTYYFMNPLFAREGAIIPRAYVDNKTMNALGKRWGEDPRNELIVRVFASKQPTDFTLYEDDGVSRGYLRGKVRETKISQRLTDNSEIVTIEKSKGDFIGAPQKRPNVLELVVRDRKAKKVSVDGQNVASCSESAISGFDSGKISCWYQPKTNLIRIKTESLSTQNTKTFEIQF